MSSIKKQCSSVLLFLFLFAQVSFAGELPDPTITPGAINPDVTQENIHQTICVKGYSKTIRPPAYYTNKLKKRQLIEYGYGRANPRNFEEDHLINISIGGNPTDPKNLWPQPHNTTWNAAKKDELELVLQKLVCRGKIPLAAAQKDIASNWIEAYKKYIGQ